jgi:hypothetical protein
MTKLSDEAIREYDKVADQLWKKLFPEATMTYQEALKLGLLDHEPYNGEEPKKPWPKDE